MLTGVSGRAHPARAGRHGRRWRSRPPGPPGGPARQKRSRWARRALTLTAAGLVLLALFALYLSQSLTTAVTSDGAANVLQALAMDHGNPLLRQWWTSDVSFYPTEVVEYALVAMARGRSPDVVHICGALTYTLTVLLTVALARGRGRGSGGWYRAGIAAGILLAPSLLGGTSVFLENPDHAGTAVPVLLLLLLLDGRDSGAPEPGPATPAGGTAEQATRPGPRVRWYVAAGACALLALTQLADPLSLAAATVPLAVVCVARLAATAIRRRPAAGFAPDGLLLAAAAGSVAAARLAARALRSAGGFDVRSLRNVLLAPPGQLPVNARVVWHSVVLLFGANGPGPAHRPIMISRHLPLVLLADLHVIGLGLAAAGLVAGAAAIVAGRAGRVDGILVAAIGLTLAAGIVTQVMRSLAAAHEIALVVPLAAALAGRTLPPLARRLASAGRQDRVWPARLAAVALAGWLTLGAAGLGYAAAWPAAPSGVPAVAAWLVAHHERDGLAGYWQADVTTLASGGRVLVAPVNPGPPARVFRWESSQSWYRPGQHRATFVIAVPGPSPPPDSLTPAAARAMFGPPATRHLVGGELILTYRYNLLPRLRSRSFPGTT